jgi:hypothetical protein
MRIGNLGDEHDRVPHATLSRPGRRDSVSQP